VRPRDGAAEGRAGPRSRPKTAMFFTRPTYSPLLDGNTAVVPLTSSPRGRGPPVALRAYRERERRYEESVLSSRPAEGDPHEDVMWWPDRLDEEIGDGWDEYAAHEHGGDGSHKPLRAKRGRRVHWRLLMSSQTTRPAVSSETTAGVAG
jgi:hypothetical protein